MYKYLLFAPTRLGCVHGLIVVGVVRCQTATALAWDDPRMWAAVADLIVVAILWVLVIAGAEVYEKTVLDAPSAVPDKDETVVRVASPKGTQVAANVAIHPPTKPKANDSSEFELTLDP